MSNASMSDEPVASLESPHSRIHRFGRLVIGVGLTTAVFLAGYFSPRIDLGWILGSQEPSPAILKVEFPNELVFSPVSYQDRVEQNRRNLRRHLLLLTSPDVISKAISYPTIASLSCLKGLKDPVAWLRGCIKVENPQDSELLIVTMTDGPLAERPPIINAVVDSYLDLSRTWTDELNAARLVGLKNMEREIKATLDLLRKRRHEFLESKDNESVTYLDEELSIYNEMFRRLTLKRSELEYNESQESRLFSISQAKAHRPNP